MRRNPTFSPNVGGEQLFCQAFEDGFIVHGNGDATAARVRFKPRVADFDLT